MAYALYIASAIGAVSVFLMLPRRGFNPRKLGALLGAFTLGGLWLVLWRRWSDVEQPLGLARGALPYYYIFSAIAIASAVRVITHTRPVYSALWFVMVVLATAGLFLTLSAEFIAFALVIIYGGAILVTYVFVIMLASEAGDPIPESDSPEYERVAREPAIAVFAGFLLLAVVLTLVFDADRPLTPNVQARALSDRLMLRGDPSKGIAPILPDRAVLHLNRALVREGRAAPAAVYARQMKLDNIERVGVDLFRSNLLGLELAGVILLVSLIGAVVIARQNVPVSSASSNPPPPTPDR